LKFGVKSDKGLIREKNEDSFNVIAGKKDVPVSFIIADGMGGHNSGEVASSMSVDYISNYIIEHPELFKDENTVEISIKKIVEAANEVIYRKSLEVIENSGMGTTLIMASVVNGKLFIGHVGDSRAYLIRNGVIKRITTDHSYIEELIKNGSLTREEADNHPQKHIITRALGCSDSITPDTYKCEIMENDIYILCTDGLTNMLSENDIKDIVEQNEDPAAASSKLVEKANSNGGADNITVIVFKNN
jgi:protein phosphatase